MLARRGPGLRHVPSVTSVPPAYLRLVCAPARPYDVRRIARAAPSGALFFLRWWGGWVCGRDGRDEGTWGGNAQSPRNGVVIMLCDVQMRQEGAARRLEERTLGVVHSS